MAKASFLSSGTIQAGTPASGSLQSGSYTYTFVPVPAGYALEVRSEKVSLTSTIKWTFGAGNHGQTYLLDQNGALYEAQVSSFATRSLGLTPGHSEASRDNLPVALGNRLSSLDVARCFSCHATAWVNEPHDSTRTIPGIHCEACHGPGAKHVQAARQGRMEDAARAILNPANLDPVTSVDFCGACHRTSMDIVLTGPPGGFSGIRFQPYRLQKSTCWKRTEDARLTCIACHDPHEPLVQDATSYDKKCLSCHGQEAGAQRVAVIARPTEEPRPCPKATAKCVTCHMPRYTVPEMHSQFTDHFIRIVRTGAAFPR